MLAAHELHLTGPGKLGKKYTFLDLTLRFVESKLPRKGWTLEFLKLFEFLRSRVRFGPLI